MRRIANIALTSTLAAALAVSSTPLPAFAATGDKAQAASATASAKKEQAASGGKEDAQHAPETDGIIVTLDKGSAGASTLSEDGGEAAVLSSPAAQTLRDAGLTPTEAFATVDGSVAIAAQPADGQTDKEALAAAQGLGGVASAQYNFVYRPIDPETGDIGQDGSTASARSLADTLSSSISLAPVNDPITQNRDPSSPLNQYWAYNSKLVSAWRMAQATTDVEQQTIAVMDTGINFSHEDLSENVLSSEALYVRAYREDGGTFDANSPVDMGAYRYVDDGSGHGTHVAGIAAAVSNNGRGLSGASDGAKILPLKVTKVTSITNGHENHTADSKSFIAAYEYLFREISLGRVRNLHVVNISMGGYQSDDMHDLELEAAIQKARDQYGILTFCAGGNSADSDEPTEPLYPADFDAAVAVTPLDADGTNHEDSDYNQYKDISAPGERIWSTTNSSNNSYGTLTGSSMASPVAAGTAALLFSADPDATPSEVEAAIESTADPIVDSNDDRSQTSGSKGALNAVMALDQVLKDDISVSFPDVTSGDWFSDAVLFNARHGIMSGYSGNFVPAGNLTRAQMAQLLYNYFGNGEVSPAAGLSDVDQTQWYADAVNWAVAHGVMTGYDGGAFVPNDPLTREQACMTFAKLLVGANGFQDADMTKFAAAADHDQVSAWARKAVAWALNQGIVGGNTNDAGEVVLNPTANCSRAEMAQIMMNNIKKGLL